MLLVAWCRWFFDSAPHPIVSTPCLDPYGSYFTEMVVGYSLTVTVFEKKTFKLVNGHPSPTGDVYAAGSFSGKVNDATQVKFVPVVLVCRQT